MKDNKGSSAGPTAGSTDLALYILSGVLLLGAVLVMTVPARLVNR